jgi:hypothetical protein
MHKTFLIGAIFLFSIILTGYLIVEKDEVAAQNLSDEADLGLIITTPSSMNVQKEVPINITLKNNGPFDATNVMVKLILSEVPPFSEITGDPTYNPMTGTLNVGTVPNGQNKTFLIYGKPQTTGIITMDVESHGDQVGTNKTNSTNISITGSAIDLTNWIIAPTHAIVNETIPVEVHVMNNGQDNATNVKYNITKIYGIDSETGENKNQIIPWYIGTLTNNSEEVYYFNVTYYEPGNYTIMSVGGADQFDPIDPQGAAITIDVETGIDFAFPGLALLMVVGGFIMAKRNY